MAEDKPWALISEVGNDGYVEEVVDIMKQHFHLICLKDFLQNPTLHGPNIRAMFMWNYYPKAQPSLLKSLPSLKVVASGGVGIDHLDVPLINSFGVKVANTPGVVSDATADIAMGLLLASARKIVEGESNENVFYRLDLFHVCEALSGSNWTWTKRVLTCVFLGHMIAVDPKTSHIPQSLMGVEVTGSTLGIIGMGDIGYRIAQRSKGFNMRILYHNRNRR